MNKKLIYLVLSVFILIILAICGYFIWQGETKTNSTVDNLKTESLPQLLTYSNVKYGYEFKYPEETRTLGMSALNASPVFVFDKDNEDAMIEIKVVTPSWFSENYPSWKPEAGLNLKTYLVGNKTVMDVKNFNNDTYRMLVAGEANGSSIVLAKQNKQTDFLDKIFDTLILTNQESSINELKKEFSYPYAVSWRENNVEFSLKEVFLGKTLAPQRTYDGKGSFFQENEEIYALSLVFKITNYNSTHQCVNLNLRRVVNEEGDMVAANTDQFHFSQSGGCMIPGGISETQKVVFVVPETDKTFEMTTFGLSSNVFFTINLLEADGNVRTEPSLQLEKSIEEEGLRELQPYNANVFVCKDGGNNFYRTIGQASKLQNWFVYGGCPLSKDYKVMPNKEIVLDIKTDISTCTDCVCNYPIFSIYEYRGSEFIKTKDFNFYKESGGVLEKVYYTPNTDRIKIVAEKCFYLNVFQEGEADKRITLNSLNDGQPLQVGKTYKIIWSSANLNGNINMELVNKEDVEGKSGATSWEINYNRIPLKNGTYEWKLDGLPSQDQSALYKIHIFSNENVYIEDYSDNYFSITK